MSREKFAVIDGSSLFFRAFYALQLPPNARGVHTNAVHGFAMMLVKLLKELSPTQIVIAFDKSRTTFRTALYPDYKGTRDKTPEELIAQIPLLKELAAALGIPFLEMDDYEADDIIGTLATQAAEQGAETVVVTGDRDALQLIRPDLTVLLTKKGISDTRRYDTAAFEEEYGFAPIRLIDMKGLMGDSSDNIPGVPGVGPKTATKLLLAYGTIENVLDHAAEVSGKKLSTSLVEYRDQALLSKQLATIECAVPELRYTAEDFRMQPDRRAVEAFCGAYELRTVGRAFSDYLGTAAAATVTEQSLFPAEEERVSPVSYDAAELTAAEIASLRTAERIAVGAVFSGTPPFVQIDQLALFYGAEQRIVPADAAHYDEVCAILAERSIVLWNAKRYAQAGLTIGANVFDLELADYLLRPEESKRDIERAAFARLGTLPEATDDLCGAQRAVHEALLAARLMHPMQTALDEAGLTTLYRTVELPLVPVLAAMEQTGIYVNRAALERELAAANVRIDTLVEEIHTLAGTEFNISSPKQLGEILFERLGLAAGSKVKKTKTGLYSTGEEVLEKLRSKHPIVDKLLDYRRVKKLLSTYIDALPERVDPATGKIHTSFNQTVTSTGRLSSSNPNLQNIPVREELGREIRKAFTADDAESVFFSADYSQIELRIMAHFSGDEHMTDAFRHGADIHAATAAKIFGVAPEEVTSDMRRRAKTANFGIIYGISAFGLAERLAIPRAEARELIDGYFASYPRIKAYMDASIQTATEQGYVETLFGRRMFLPDIRSRNAVVRGYAERGAINAPIQGTAADIIKIAMIGIRRRFRQEHLRSRMILQVHDELNFNVRKEELDVVRRIVREEMEGAAKLSVPLTVDCGVGRNWLEAH